MVAFACWLVSILTREYSWVDRLWSMMPPLYVGWFAAQAGFANPRLDLMLALTMLWGVRLSFNFARKGGFRRGGEDYRWAALRELLGPIGFQLLNATFIAPYQNLLLLLISLPAAVVLAHPAPLGPIDGVLTFAFLLLLVGETVADQQQWRFQEDKRQRRERGETTTPFLDRGLFRYSRHPNFFCEISIWWCIAGFALATGVLDAPVDRWDLAQSLVGAVLLTLLFQGSTAFTEWLTKRRYPQYVEYQRRVSRLVPWPPGPAAKKYST